MMTEKDFERIAQVFRVNHDANHYNAAGKEIAEMTRCNLIDDMCVELKAINPRFNKETFIKACNQ